MKRDWIEIVLTAALVFVTLAQGVCTVWLVAGL